MTSEKKSFDNLHVLDDDWKLKGACRGKDVNMFFEFGHARQIVRNENEMKEFCVNACSVRARCLLWALFVPEEFGVWGGMTADERALLRKDQRTKTFLAQFKLDSITSRVV